jgi:alpha-glucosidase
MECGLAQSAWWKNGIIYQVYPRSFQDSNADGVGDLNGIVRRLDYLAWLNIDAIWISPAH